MTPVSGPKRAGITPTITPSGMSAATDPSTVYAIEALEVVRDTLVEHPERWTKGVMFRDRDRRALPGRDPSRACSACLLGMVRIAVPSNAPEAVDARNVIRGALHRALNGARNLHPTDIVDWNDHRDRCVSEVRVLVNGAIERLKAGR